MRVLFFSSIFPRDWNVTKGIYCFHACRALIELGHEVRVVSPRSWLEKKNLSAPKMLGLAELRVDYPTYLHVPRVMQSRSDRMMELSSQRAITRVMRDFRPECVLSYWVHPDGEVAARAAKANGIPSAVIVGGSDVLVLAKHAGRRRKRSVVRALHANDAIITVGRDLAEVVQSLGVPKDKVHVVYQGIDLELFNEGGSKADARARLKIDTELGSKTQMLVSVGSLLPIKGIDVAIDALAKIKSSVDAKLYLVGDGPARPELEARAQRLGITNMVRFAGKVDQRALPDWYRAADLTLLSSRSEGVPNVLRESLACGTPFVATRVGGVHEMARGQSEEAARLVPPEDPSLLAEAIDQSLKNPAVVSREGLLSWKESTQQIVEIFRGLRS